MPVYNAERYVARAVESILAQTFRDFEFLITDDGSTDTSLSILRSFEARDDRIRIISRPNTGYVIALNEMLAKAQGEFIARMDADDIARGDRFALQMAALRVDPSLVAVGSSVTVIDPDGFPLMTIPKPIDHEAIDAWHLTIGGGAAICHPTVLIRASALDKIGSYRTEYWPAEDADLFLRLAEVGRLANLPQELLSYRFHVESVGHLHGARQRDAVYRAAVSAAERRGLPPPKDRVYSSAEEAPQTLADNLRKWAWWALQNGHVETARRHARGALRAEPLSLKSWHVALCAARGR